MSTTKIKKKIYLLPNDHDSKYFQHLQCSTLGNAMAEALEEKPKISHQFDSAQIFNTIKQIGKLREQQYQEFLKKQSDESKPFLGLSNESCQSNEQNFSACSGEEEIPNAAPIRGDISSSSLGNDSNDTLQESSITGHLQRCFDDSSQNNVSLNPNKVSSVPEKIPIFSEIRNLQFLKKFVNEEDEGLVKGTDSNSQHVKKRPFLKKGTGLVRFTTKGAAKIKEKRLSKPDNPTVKTTIKLPQKNLNLKPAIRKADVPSEQSKHIRFDIPLSDQEKNVEHIISSKLPANSISVENVEIEHSDKDECCAPSPSSAPLQEDYTDREVEKQDHVGNESKELAEFEMLENIAQNSSFNSDSSFLQRIIHGDSNKVICLNKKEHETVKSNTNPSELFGISDSGNVVRKVPESSSYPLNIGFDECHKKIQARKEELNKVIADIKPRLKCLENEITDAKKEVVMENGSGERFRTPSEERIECSSSPETNECFTNIHISSASSFPDELVTESHSIKNVENFYRHQANDESFSEDEEESAIQVPGNLHVDERTSVEKSMITEKYVELQNEIEIYQQLNKRLTLNDAKRNEFIRKLQKERDDFEKYKENERKKLEAEIKEERRQIKRQKESFTRLQKLSKDHPTRKEREELNALRHKVEKLEEELKRQHLKYSSDSRKWKNRIDAAENERDSLRLENMKLEEQCEDLLAALKPRKKKRSELVNCEGDNEMHGKISNVIPEKKHAETQTDVLDFSELKNSTQVTTESSNVNNNFKVISDCDKNDAEIPINDIDSSQHSSKSCTPRNDNVIVSQKNVQNMTKDHIPSDLSVISVSADAEFHEVKYGSWTERIHMNGQREIIFNSGIRKVISKDRKSITFYFYNGDVKEIYPDKREIYRYVNGITETTSPDGIKVTQLPNGKAKYYYPDGKKEIRFPDGKKEIRFPDGSSQVINGDGTQIIQYINGQVEIRTATFQRREFPDGHIKITHKDGKIETRYPNGRVKLKDKDGTIIFDTKYVPI